MWFNGKSWIAECQDVVELLYTLLYNKSTTNRSNGDGALLYGPYFSRRSFTILEADKTYWTLMIDGVEEIALLPEILQTESFFIP